MREATLLAPLLVAVVAVMVAATVLVDVVTATRIVRAEHEYLAAGGDLLVARRQNEAPLDAAACVAVENLAGVRSVAAVSVRPGVTGLVGRPESKQTLVLATAGVLDMLDLPQLGANDVVASQTVAERWLWSPGSHVQLDPTGAADLGAPPGVLTVAGVADLALLSEGASTGLLALRPPTGPSDMCFVRIEPQYRADLHQALPAALGSRDGATVMISDRLPAGAGAVDPAAAFDARTTRWAPPFAGLVVGLVWVVVSWTRRGRSALYASVGVPYSGGVLMRWTEGGAIVGLGGLWGTAVATTGSISLLGAPPTAAVPLGSRGGAAALCAAAVVVVLVGLWRPPTLAALKDR